MPLLAALVLAACSQSSATTTNAPPETTTTPATTIAPETSEDVAVAFFEAWRTQDRAAMELLAEPAALAEADDLADLASENWEPQPCEGAAGTVFCSWMASAGTLAVGVQNIQEPHIVTSVRLLETGS